MGIRFYCPNGHKLNVKPFQAGRRGICPYCGASVDIPTKSTRRSSRSRTTTSQRSTERARSGGRKMRDRNADGAVEQPRAGGAGSRGQRVSTSVGPQAEIPASAVDRPGVDLTRRDFPTVAGPTAKSAASEPQAPASTYAGRPGAGQPPPVPSRVGDPLAEAPDAVWYVRPASGGQFGPATAETMRCWIAEGRVRGDSLVWREGWRDWRHASATFLQLETDDEISALAGAVAEGDSAGGGPRGRHRGPSRRSKTANRLWIAGLTLLVIVLLIVFVWVLLGR